MTGDGRMQGQSHCIIWGIFYCLLSFLSKYKISLTFESTVYFLLALEVRKWKGKVCEHFRAILLFILGKMSHA